MHVCITQPQWVNSLDPGRCGSNFKSNLTESYLKHILWNCPQNSFDGKSTLVLVIVWWLSQCWLWSMSPYDITRPQCVNSLCNEIWCQIPWSSLVQVILFGNMPIPKPMLTCCQLHPEKWISVLFKEMHFRMLSAKWWPFFLASACLRNNLPIQAP